MLKEKTTVTVEEFDRAQNRLAAKQVMQDLSSNNAQAWWVDFSNKLNSEKAKLLRLCRDQFLANLEKGEAWCPNCGAVSHQYKTTCWSCNGYVAQSDQ